MSRPTTRSKNKRHRQGDDGNGTAEIWRKIHNSGVVAEDDMNQLYMIWKPVCSGCRVNTKDNPNCFCALIPPQNGTRKSGLWQKMSDFVESLGHDPTKDLRATANCPAGLTNLGATCYANSILQCLYMNQSFREGIFSLERDVLEQQAVLDQLTRLFVQLHVSKMAFIDSSPFVRTLELDNGVQQDSHEFLTLLLSLLEGCLSHSKVPKARRIVQDLFRGSVSHVTTCSQCGRDSEASSKMEDFYELELNVKGLKSLDQSLDEYLTVEELNGDNQYFCESCKGRVDATRSIKLCTLPKVLNFQLKRYVFLPKYGGGPALSHDNHCLDCLIHGAMTVVSADTYRDRRESMKSLARDILDGNCLDGKYYISRPWLQQWWKRKVLDAPSEADAGPTAPISCPHDELLPEKAPGAKRVLIPESFWFFLYEDAVSVKPDDPLGGPSFSSDSKECSQCSNELSEVACLEDSLRLVKQKQRQNHDKLFQAKSLPLSLNCKYFLVPSSWISQWRNYINPTLKNSDKPETLDGAIDSLLCEKHSQLLERPPELVFRRGAIIQRESSVGGLTIVSENDWKCFCEEWGGIENKGIFATIDHTNDPDNVLTGSSEEMLICKDQLGTEDKMNYDNGTGQIFIKTCPEVCESCIGERESCKLMQKLNYCNEDICVILVRGKEVPRSMLEASKGFVETDRRVSKRSRKTKNGSSISLKVSASTSLYQLKMMIWESFGVVKENQILHKGDRIIDSDNECVTLADVNIFAGDQIIVRDSEIHENRDIADELCDDKMDLQHTEEGFRGTLLTANVSSQVV
ncbi:hypothetical protein ACSQ67_018807 [Phaseolus vulgaris]